MPSAGHGPAGGAVGRLRFFAGCFHFGLKGAAEIALTHKGDAQRAERAFGATFAAPENGCACIVGSECRGKRRGGFIPIAGGQGRGERRGIRADGACIERPAIRHEFREDGQSRAARTKREQRRGSQKLAERPEAPAGIIQKNHWQGYAVCPMRPSGHAGALES